MLRREPGSYVPHLNSAPASTSSPSSSLPLRAAIACSRAARTAGFDLVRFPSRYHRTSARAPSPPPDLRR
jgi:hypothetical protein